MHDHAVRGVTVGSGCLTSLDSQEHKGGSGEKTKYHGQVTGTVPNLKLLFQSNWRNIRSEVGENRAKAYESEGNRTEEEHRRRNKNGSGEEIDRLLREIREACLPVPANEEPI